MKEKQKIIYRSTDYSLFIQDDLNRTASKHQKLFESMSHHGWLPEHPAVVVPQGGKFRIKDGGHRITIAERLKLPVYYVLSSGDNISIAEINAAQKTWSATDYISSFIKQGNSDYSRLVAFASEVGIPVGAAAGLLCGGTSSVTSKIRDGSFKITTEDHARNVLAVVGAASQVVKWAKSQRFIGSVSLILRFSRANAKTLCDKIRSHGGMLIPQVTTEAMIEMLENIYNYRARDIVSISLAVRQALRQAKDANIKKATEARKTK